MAKSKSLAANKRRRRARRRKNAAHMVMNPPVGKDIAQDLVPAFIAYAGTRLASRIAFTLVQRRWPKAGKHVGAATSLGSALAAYLLSSRVETLKEHQAPIIVGSGIATLQTLVRTYVPRYGWIVADYKPEDLEPAGQRQQLPGADEDAELEEALKGYMEEDEYSYLEREVQPSTPSSPPRRSAPAPAPAPAPPPAPSTDELDFTDEDLLDDSDIEQFQWPN